MQQKLVITHPNQAGHAHSPARIKTTPKARSKRRSTHLPNQTQYGSILEQFWSKFTGRKPV